MISRFPNQAESSPNFLAEIRWNLDWMLSLQDSDGGVWHKQTRENFCGFVLPQDDHLVSFVIGTGSAPYKSTCATADLAAVAAIAARCYGPFDDAHAKNSMESAKRAYAWASKIPMWASEIPQAFAPGSTATLTAVTNCTGPLQNCDALVARNNIVRYSRPESLTSG